MKLREYMKLNFSMIQTELFFIVLFGVMLGFSIVTVFFLILLGLPLMAGVGYFTYQTYRKLFYDSMYGRGGAMYMGLPVEPKTVVLGKILTAGCTDLIFLAVVLLVMVCFGVFGGEVFNLTEILTEAFGIASGRQGMLVSALLLWGLNLIVGTFTVAAFYLLAVIRYNGLQKRQRNMASRLLTGALTIAAINVVSHGTEWIRQGFNLEYTAAIGLAALVIQLAALAYAVKQAVKKLESRYQLG